MIGRALQNLPQRCQLSATTVAATDGGRAVVVAASGGCCSVASHRTTMSADAISRLSTNITLVVRRRMRHTHVGNQRGGERSQQENGYGVGVCVYVRVCMFMCAVTLRFKICFLTHYCSNAFKFIFWKATLHNWFPVREQSFKPLWKLLLWRLESPDVNIQLFCFWNRWSLVLIPQTKRHGYQ